MGFRTDAEIISFGELPGENSADNSFIFFLAQVLGSHLDSLDNPWEIIKAMIKDPHLKQKILHSCRSGQFDAVREDLAREFGIQNLSSQKVEPDLVKATHVMGLLKQSFEEPFVGDAHEGLYKYLENNNKLFGEKNPATYYAKFCSIVQSSGTGKSRAMIELRTKGVIVLYINIRGKDETDTFPPRDDLLADLLTEKLPLTADEYARRCSAFFIAIFRALRNKFTSLSESITAGGAALIEAFNKQVCSIGLSERNSFFRMIKEEYTTVKRQLDQSSEQDSEVSKPTAQAKHHGNPAEQDAKGEPDEEACTNQDIEEPMASHMTPSSSRDRFKTSDPNSTPVPGHKVLENEYQVWIQFSGSLLAVDESSNKPHLVIELDEAHVLSKSHEGYRPSNILCRVISAYSRRRRPSWVLFASTTLQVADFSAPANTFFSSRVSKAGEMLFAPYLHLGWDQYAKKIKDIRPQDVASFRHIAALGRPLWYSLIHVHGSPSPIMDLACEKLCGEPNYTCRSSGAALAVLGARFYLDICLGHHEANEFHTRAVAGHMRFLQSVTPDRVWQTTNYPSEPILACAAAMLLHKDNISRSRALSFLLGKIKTGMVDIGRFGELASRLILLLAKDWCVQQKYSSDLDSYHGAGFEASLPYCRPIPVVDFLEELFGTWILEEDAKREFANWWLNFSHWVPMDGKIWEEKLVDWLPRRSDFIKRHWYRTSAVQCCHNQRMIDKVIPIFFDDKTGSSEPRFSQILVSDKAGNRSSRPNLSKITPRKAIGYDTSEPYIAILLDMGHDPDKKPTRKVEPKYESGCLRIYARGVTEDTFPFLKNYPTTSNLLLELLQIGKAAVPDPAIARLAAQANFGKTVGDEHTLWDVQPNDYQQYRKDEGISDFWQG